MRQRGRRSAAGLSVVAISCDAQRPPPPEHLKREQAKIWREIVDSTPAGWFRSNDVLLELYCRHVHTASQLAKLIDAHSGGMGEIKTLDRLLRMRERETRMMTHLATKMRLTQQSRIAPRSAGQQMEDRPLTSKPIWEV